MKRNGELAMANWLAVKFANALFHHLSAQERLGCLAMNLELGRRRRVGQLVGSQRGLGFLPFSLRPLLDISQLLGFGGELLR